MPFPTDRERRLAAVSQRLLTAWNESDSGVQEALRQSNHSGAAWWREWFDREFKNLEEELNAIPKD